jgi:hypothetical protein
MMRKILATVALITTTMFTPGLIPEAQASGWFSVGSAFRVGAAHISFVFGRPLDGIGPAYYFRYDRPISYSGYRCNRYCYREENHYYHHEACPVVGAHFHRHDVDPYWAFSRYAPRFDGYEYGYGGRYNGYHDRYDSDDNSGRSYYRDRYDGYRDDRYDDSRGRGRYNRSHDDDYSRDRGRRGGRRHHQHGPSCRH